MAAETITQQRTAVPIETPPEIPSHIQRAIGDLTKARFFSVRVTDGRFTPDDDWTKYVTRNDELTINYHVNPASRSVTIGQNPPTIAPKEDIYGFGARMSYEPDVLEYIEARRPIADRPAPRSIYAEGLS